MASKWGVLKKTVVKERPASSMFDVVMLFQAAAKSGILAHEVNKGAPCLVCGDACPGFELHFWRKHCTLCKCGPASHQINDDLVAVFGRRDSLQPTSNAGASRSTLNVFEPAQIRRSSIAVAVKKQQKLDKRKVGPPTKPKPRVGKESEAVTVSPIYDTASPGTVWDETPEVISFVWEPAGLEPAQVLQYFESYPEEQVPIVGYSGEQEFRLEMDKQLPAHDFDPEKCHDLTSEERAEFVALKEMKKEAHCVGVAITVTETVECAGCREVLDVDNVAVELVIKKGKHYHPKCLTCATCNQICVGMNTFIHKDQMYCARHYNDIFKARCAACDESIMEDSYVKAEGHCWHRKHFCCQMCDVHLAGQRYVPIETKPHCVDCYYKLNPDAKTATVLSQPEPEPESDTNIRSNSVVSVPSGDKPGGQIYELASSRIVPRQIMPAQKPPEYAQARPVRPSSTSAPPVDEAPKRKTSSSSLTMAETSMATPGKGNKVKLTLVETGEVTPVAKPAPAASATRNEDAPPPLPKRGVSHHGETAASRQQRKAETLSAAAKKRPVSMRTHGETPPTQPAGGQQGEKKRPVSMRTHGAVPPPLPPDEPKVNIKVHVPDADTYDVLWPEEEERIRLATAVPSQFAKSTRRGKPKKPVGFSALAEEPEEAAPPPRPPRKPTRRGASTSDADDVPAPPVPSRGVKPRS